MTTMTAVKRGVLFDLYGTLVDLKTDESSRAAWEAVAAHLGRRGSHMTSQQVHRRYDELCADAAHRLGEGFALHAALEALLAEAVDAPVRESEIVALARIVRQSTVEQLSLRDYAIPLLRHLRQAGMRLGLVSNTESLMTNYDLEKIPLRNLFDEVVLSSDEGVAKPDAAIFERAASRLCLSPDELVHIGDSAATDATGARAAGIDLVLLSDGSIVDGGEPRVPSTLDGILAALRRLGCPV